MFIFTGDTLIEHRNTSIGNIASGEIKIVAEASDNGAMYKCTASNKATSVPLEAVKKLTVHCKSCSKMCLFSDLHCQLLSCLFSASKT